MSEEQTLTLEETELNATLNGGVTDDIGSETTEETLTDVDWKKKYEESEARAKKAESTIVKHKKQNKRSSEISEDNNRLKQQLEALEKDKNQLNMELRQAQEDGYSEEHVQRLERQIQDNVAKQQEAKGKEEANDAQERLQYRYGDDWEESLQDMKEGLRDIFKKNNEPDDFLDKFVNNPTIVSPGRFDTVQDMMYTLGQKTKEIASLKAQLAEKDKTLKNPNLNNQRRIDVMSSRSPSSTRSLSEISDIRNQGF